MTERLHMHVNRVETHDGQQSGQHADQNSLNAARQRQKEVEIYMYICIF